MKPKGGFGRHNSGSTLAVTGGVSGVEDPQSKTDTYGPGPGARKTGTALIQHNPHYFPADFRI